MSDDNLQSDINPDVAETPDSETGIVVDQDINENEHQEPIENAEPKDDANADNDPANNGVQAAINRKHRQYMDQVRENERLNQQLETLRNQLDQGQGAGEPIVPELPDPFDDDYEAKIQARDSALRQRHQWEVQQQIAGLQQQQQQQQQLQQQQLQIEAAVNQYTDKAKKLGIEPDKLKQAGDTVSPLLGDNLTMQILMHPTGPLITKYLAENPRALIELSEMPDFQAGAFIQTFDLQQQKQQKVVKPPHKIGTGITDSDTKQYPGLKGAKIY